MKKIIRKIFNQSHYVKVAVAAVVIIVAPFLFKSYQNIENSYVFREGVSTCFDRLKQTFTARVLSDSGSAFLTQSFFSTTEECIGEAIANLQSINKKIVDFPEAFGTKDILTQANTFSRLSHRFHTKLSDDMKTNSWDAGSTAKIIGRFGKLEDAKEEIVGNIESLRDSIKDKFIFLGTLFLLSILSLVGMIVRSFFKTRVIYEVHKNCEDRASEMIMEDNVGNYQDVLDLLKGPLRLFNFDKCEKLLETSMMLLNREKLELKKTALAAFDTLENNSQASREKNKLLVEHVSSTEREDNYLNSSENMKGLEKINLENTVSQVVDILSQKIFTQGIVLDLNIDDEVYVWAQIEAITQVFYNLINNSIKSLRGYDGNKKIQVDVKKLGNLVKVEISDSGKGFSEKLLSDDISQPTDFSKFGAGLTICNEFMNEFKGKMFLANSDETSGGARVNLLFKRVPRASLEQKRVVSVMRGHKKEILNHIRDEHSV